MAEGESPPLRDPGGLHVYNMNGSSHKMAELVLGEPPAGHNSNLNCQMASSSEMYSDVSVAVSFPPTDNSNLHQNPHSPHFLQIEPINYPDPPGIYEELKRSSGQIQTMPYYTNLDSSGGGQSDANMYEYTSSTESYNKPPDTNTMPGYVDMLGNSDSMICVKREKIDDFSDTIGLVNTSHSPDIPYPPNTCVPDWNFYNQASSNNSFQSHSNHGNNHHPPAAYGYQGQPSQSFSSNIMFNNTQNVPPHFQSNDDIHYQSKKITQSILSSEWPPESLYKSHVYSNLAMDQMGRKRRTEMERPKNAKSRRKKSSSSDIGGHSKTVASILLSENSTQGSNASSSSEILDSAARNTLVSTLMDNIRSTVQFESFCLSLPRTDAKENAFRHKVQSTADMVQSIQTYDVQSQPFPSNFVMGASKVVSNFRNALKNTSSKPDDDVDCCNSLNLSMDQVEEHLPHSMVWVLRLGVHTLTANWEGQFVVGVNPVQNILSISIFQFQPQFSCEGIKCLQQMKLSKDLAADITHNMQQFEVSRQLRCDINLKKVIQLYLFKPNGEKNEGCLVLELAEQPQFYQRWLHTSAENKNKWRQRQNFFTKSEGCESEVLCIGGLVSELNEIVALLLASDQDLEGLYEAGVCSPFTFQRSLSTHRNHGINKGNNVHRSDKLPNQRRLLKSKRPLRKLGSNLNKLRKEIVEVLVHHRIMEKQNVDKTFSNACLKSEKDDVNSEVCLGINLNKDICSCLQDFVNYSCDSATELNTILEMEVKPRAYGFYENDFDMSKVPDENIDRIKVGELISSRCSEIVYYSFCNGDVGQLGYDRHCGSCRRCRTMKYWHCEVCDQCTDSRAVCQYCGHLRNDQSTCIVKPLSVFKSQFLSGGSVSLDDVKAEWKVSLQQPYDDTVILDTPKLDIKSADIAEYNSQNAMVDQLGLLNPVAFLLGQNVAGASRKHRRYKGGQLNDVVPHSIKGKLSSTGSGCCVQ